MMSQRSKRELLEEIRPRYLKAKKSKEKIMLDEFVAATGSSKVCDPDPETWLSTTEWQETWIPQDLPRRSGGCTGADLGSMWADLLKTAAAFYPRDGEGAGAMWRIDTTCGNQKAFIADEFCHNRPSFGPSSL